MQHSKETLPYEVTLTNGTIVVVQAHSENAALKETKSHAEWLRTSVPDSKCGKCGSVLHPTQYCKV